jgi:hypothetical protein
MKALADGVYAIAATLWVGALWTVGYLVAPLLFATLSDTALAGSLAGKLFSWVAYIGLGCAAYMLLFRIMRFGGGAFRHGITWVVIVMLLLTAVGQFGVGPVLAALKDRALPAEVMASVFRDRFAAWHGVASVLYVIVSGLGLLLVWLQGKDPR